MQVSYNGKLYNIDFGKKFQEEMTDELSEALLNGFIIDSSMVGRMLRFVGNNGNKSETFANKEIIPYGMYKDIVGKAGTVLSLHTNNGEFPDDVEKYIKMEICGHCYEINPKYLHPVGNSNHTEYEPYEYVDNGTAYVSSSINDCGTVTIRTDQEFYTTRESYASAQQLSTLEERINELERKCENVTELVNLYKKRCIEKINKEYVKEENEIIAKDPIEEYKNQLFTIKEAMEEHFKDSELKVKCTIGLDYTYAEDTRKQLEELTKNVEKKRAEVNELCEEVEARLSLCENEESKIKVLKSYDILGKDGRINA